MAIIEYTYIHIYVKGVHLRLRNRECRVNRQLVGVGTNYLRYSVVAVIYCRCCLVFSLARLLSQLNSAETFRPRLVLVTTTI